MSTNIGTDQGKFAFVVDVLNRDPNANLRIVNEAWKAAGHEGTISQSYVGKIRSKLGLTGKSRRKKGRGATAKATTRRTKARPDVDLDEVTEILLDENGALVPLDLGEDPRQLELDDLEAEFDWLLFALMQFGGLSEVERLVRRARRLLILNTR